MKNVLTEILEVAHTHRGKEIVVRELCDIKRFMCQAFDVAKWSTDPIPAGLCCSDEALEKIDRIVGKPLPDGNQDLTSLNCLGSMIGYSWRIEFKA